MTTAAISIDTMGLYTVSEASRLVRAPRQTVNDWLHADLGGSSAQGSLSPTSSTLLTFAEMISLFVVRELRKASVDVEVIRDAEHNLARLWGVDKPFAHGEFQTGYGAIVTILENRHVAIAGKAVQEILYELIKSDLRNVTYDAQQRARKWQPRDFISLRPDLQFGQPCIEGTRITTRTVAQYLGGGDTIEELAEEFEISIDQIKAALLYEESLAKRRR